MVTYYGNEFLFAIAEPTTNLTYSYGISNKTHIIVFELFNNTHVIFSQVLINLKRKK